MSPGAWLRYVCGKLGDLPRDYLSFDVETTGLNMNEDVVTQLGYAMVEDGKMVKSGAIVFNWYTGQTDSWKTWLSSRMEKTKQHVEFRDGFATGRQYGMSISRMEDLGLNPVESLKQTRELMSVCRDAGYKFLGHNGLRIDQPILHNHFKKYLNCEIGLVFQPNEYFDTLALEKGVQTTPQIDPGETWATFIKRGYYLGGNKVKCNLDQHCEQKYGLSKKHGLDLAQAHEADFDAVLTHHLLEEFREIKGRA